MMAFKYQFKLRNDASPHLYLNDIKRYMAGDKYLHPMMKNTLLLMKKTRIPYIMLATTKEIIFVPEKGLHFERALEPSITDYARIHWTPEEKETFEKDEKKFYRDILGMYQKLGYDITIKEDVKDSVVEELLKLTQKQGEKQDGK